MENPEISRSMISPRQMHKYDTHNNIPWNLAQYQTPALHFDQKQIIRRRQYMAQKKGVKVNDFYLTKKGFYMDYDLKIAKLVPGSDKHQKNQPWDSTKNDLSDEQLTQVRKSIKYSYLERIQMQEKNRTKPGVGAYNLEKSLQEIKASQQKMKSKQIVPGQKRYFYEQTQHLSDLTPGMGSYNPHLSVDIIKLNKTDHKFWIDKHGKSDKLNSSRDLIKPNPATYSPRSQSYNSFEKTFFLPKKAKQLKNGFGSDARFPYVRNNKKVIIQERPAPSRYETQIEWKGKSNMSPTKKRWNDILYTGSAPKVYH